MKTTKVTAVTVVSAGRVVVNKTAAIFKKSKNIVLLYVDMATKYAEASCYVSSDYPGVMLTATTHTLHVDKTKPDDADTYIEFRMYPGWDVFATNIGRYTMAVCLVKRIEGEHE